MKPPTTTEAAQADDLIPIPVPRRHYALVIQALAKALATEQGSAANAVLAEPTRGWTRARVVRLRQLATNRTIRTLMDMACAHPGIHVSFPEVYKRAGRTYHQARADLAGLTRILRQHFAETEWPLHVSQDSNGTVVYQADPEIAEAWNSAASD